MGNELNVTTLDTTSHNFTFQTWTFGEHSSSVLYDVAIIDENNIWAVGEIYMNDSIGNPDSKIYNAIHWNGLSWELKRIQTIFRGNLIIVPLEGIYAFSLTDIWTVGSLPIHGDGTNWIMYDVRTTIDPNLSLSRAWGSSSDNVYFIGRSGSIVHYQNGSWSKIESGTTLNLNDIWGDFNNKTQEWEILAVASNKFFNQGSVLLNIKNNTAIEINKSGLPWSLSTVWFQSIKKHYVGGDGLYFINQTNSDWIKLNEFPPYYKDRIRGIEVNDVVVSGSNGLLSHYNGVTWYHYQFNELPYFEGRLLDVEIKGNTVVSCGWKEQRSIITIGQR
jgi:hypothetical protein